MRNKIRKNEASSSNTALSLPESAITLLRRFGDPRSVQHHTFHVADDADIA